MKCPICNVDLHMTERQGVEIDYCPQCRGVWLDRGDLDKLIHKSEPRGEFRDEVPSSGAGRTRHAAACTCGVRTDGRVRRDGDN